MELIVGKTVGFCYGVKRTVEGVQKELLKDNNLYCLGEIIHNKSVIDMLENQGLKVIETVEEAKGRTVIRAHGESIETYEKLNEKGLEIIDFTCPNVLRTHDIAKEYSKKNYFIFYIAIKNHPEAVATLSFCGKNTFLIQEKEDIDEAVDKAIESNLKNILIMVQTTYNSLKFDEISKILVKKLDNKNIEIKKTICNATEIRQKETQEISANVDCMIIIGDKKSSNTNKLYDISKRNCEKVFFIQNEKELEYDKIDKVNKIGIMAGASTPKDDIDNVINTLRRWFK